MWVEVHMHQYVGRSTGVCFYVPSKEFVTLSGMYQGITLFLTQKGGF